VRGELDHRSAPILREAIEGELIKAVDVLLLDFGDLTYMDSGGLALMFEVVRRFKEPGWLGVIAAKPAAARLMEMTGLVDHACFRLLPDLPAALATLDDSGPS
jgi:anti-sigma B factor antagonist